MFAGAHLQMHQAVHVFTLVKTKRASVLNPITLKKTKIVYNFGLSECNRVIRNENSGI